MLYENKCYEVKMKSFPAYTIPPFIINQWGLLFNNQLNYLSSSYSHISQGISYISDLNSAATLKLRCSREN
ncbi:hypothetical protein AYT02_004246 [Salmonella enterica]|nr:hypothetical protein [Salmonella enterica]